MPEYIQTPVVITISYPYVLSGEDGKWTGKTFLRKMIMPLMNR